ncbi:unnamed protein product, partial [Pylaiella littoralis]
SGDNAFLNYTVGFLQTRCRDSPTPFAGLKQLLDLANRHRLPPATNTNRRPGCRCSFQAAQYRVPSPSSAVDPVPAVILFGVLRPPVARHTPDTLRRGSC